MALNSQGYSAAQIQAQLDRSMPAAKRAMLGQVLTETIAAVNAIFAALTAVVLTKAGLAIHGASSPLAKTVSAVAAVINGVMVTVAAADMPALAGTLATAKSAAWAFYTDGTSTVTVSAKTADAATNAAAIALLPPPPAGLAQIGFIVVANASGSNFVGGTTNLDAASVTTSYFDTVGPVLSPAILSLGVLGSR